MSYWTYKAPSTPDYDDVVGTVFKGTRKEWEQLSPGFRREIVRQYERNTNE